MADYFLLLEETPFEERVRPALAAAWRARGFDPCRALCVELTPAARAYGARYHTGPDEPLLCRVAVGLPFDRASWRTLVAEIMLFTAVEIPEFQSCEETLVRLLAPESARAEGAARATLAPIHQAHHGSRDLTFGAAVYRPEYAGYNNAVDVARLADYLAAVRPEQWTTAGLPGAADEEERADELAFAREWFPSLAAMFHRARERGCVIVHESIY